MARKRRKQPTGSFELVLPHFEEIFERGKAGQDLIDELYEETVEALQATVSEYAVRTRLLLEETLKSGGGKATLADAIEFGENLGKALLDAGLKDVARSFKANFIPVEKEALQYFEAFGKGLSNAGFDVTDIRAFATVQQQKFLDLADAKLVNPMRTAVAEMIGAGRPSDVVKTEVRQIMDDLGIVTRDKIAFTDTQLETLVNDSYQRYYRLTKATQAEEIGMEIVWFQGPDDKVTTPQCRFLLKEARHGVPGMWLKSEFTTKLHPALKQDPLIAGGHWNCRHTVNFVTLGFAQSMGFRVPKGAEVPTDKQVAKNAERL